SLAAGRAVRISPAAARRLSTLTAIVGIGIASLIFVLAGSSAALPPGYDVTKTKAYRHQLEMYGGHANVLFHEFLRDFGALWHGRPLAGTVLVISLVGAGVLRIVARHAEIT